MNKDRIVGAGRNTVGKGERKLGDTIGNGRLETQAWSMKSPGPSRTVSVV